MDLILTYRETSLRHIRWNRTSEDIEEEDEAKVEEEREDRKMKKESVWSARGISDH